MKSFELDESGDWTLGMVEGVDELIQCIKIILYTRAGEWFLNHEHGFRREVLEEKNSLEGDITQAIYDAIYQEPRVKEIIKVDYDLNRADRHLEVSFSLRTTEGDVEGELGIII